MLFVNHVVLLLTHTIYRNYAENGGRSVLTLVFLYLVPTLSRKKYEDSSCFFTETKRSFLS